MAMDGMKGALGMQLAITVGNEYSEFKSHHDRTLLDLKLAQGVKKNAAEITKTFSTMATSLELYVSTMEKGYPQSDALRELIKHTEQRSAKLKTDWSTSKMDLGKELDLFIAEITSIEKEWQTVQKSYDQYSKMKKEHEKVVAKGDETKIASGQSSLDSKKEDFERQMSKSIENMKTLDAKRKPLFEFCLAGISINNRSRSSAFRESLQHSLNFAVNGIDECEKRNLLDSDAEKKLTTPIPDLEKTAVVMTLKDDSSWVEA